MCDLKDFPDSMTLGEARRLLVAKVREDDSKTYCALCGGRARDDKKGITRWQAQAIKMIADYFAVNKAPCVHLATLLGNSDAARDHGASLLRHWGFIVPVERPSFATPDQKGSRGFSGFYTHTEFLWDVINGAKFYKSIIKPFGALDWTVDTTSAVITLEEALQSELNTDENEEVIDGTTHIAGVVG